MLAALSRSNAFRMPRAVQQRATVSTTTVSTTIVRYSSSSSSSRSSSSLPQSQPPDANPEPNEATFASRGNWQPKSTPPNPNNKHFRFTSKLLRPTSPPPPPPVPLSPEALSESVSTLRSFLSSHKNTLLITGAGISVASGIPDYRGSSGSYYKNHSPITHDEFISNPSNRRRYWSRSLLGYKKMSSASPNVSHNSFSYLQSHSNLKYIITQNVDSLHTLSGSPPSSIINLHGVGADCVCMSCGIKSKRDEYHSALIRDNESFFKELQASTQNEEGPDLRPDGDAEVTVDYSEIVLPDCSACGDGIIKPDVVFFGANVDKSIVERCYEMCDECDGMIVAGSSLMVYSSFRFVKEMVKMGKRILVVNVGETRADGLEGVEKMEVDVGQVFGKLVEEVEEERKQQEMKKK
ncbi:hypothetical protein TrST_g7257 [Triparma strigata]|uniref:Deacetylase sirtuin-type domain-containing protein n=1 Tax=Triparma strigata TaxID=1606541 RepID=A0A9W7ETW0_9STRA|nr:hypothetical protein TrST_g7257 [Triparma strigata]